MRLPFERDPAPGTAAAVASKSAAAAASKAAAAAAAGITAAARKVAAAAALTAVTAAANKAAVDVSVSPSRWLLLELHNLPRLVGLLLCSQQQQLPSVPVSLLLLLLFLALPLSDPPLPSPLTSTLSCKQAVWRPAIPSFPPHLPLITGSTFLHGAPAAPAAAL